MDSDGSERWTSRAGNAGGVKCRRGEQALGVGSQRGVWEQAAAKRRSKADRAAAGGAGLPHLATEQTVQSRRAGAGGAGSTPWVASGWDHGLLGRSQGSGQKGGDGQHQPVAAYARGFLAARLVPFPADRFDTSKAQFNPVTAGGGHLRKPPLGHWGVGE